MTVYLLKQQTSDNVQTRVCAVNAGDKAGAMYRAELEYGGDWQVMETHATLEDIQYMVEDSPTEAVLLNI